MKRPPGRAEYLVLAAFVVLVVLVFMGVCAGIVVLEATGR